MSATALPSSPGAYSEPTDPRHWLFAGLAIMFALIGAGILLSVLTAPHPAGWGPWMMNWGTGWDWLFGLIMLILVIWIVVWVVRLAVWGATGGFAAPRYYRHYRRWGGDPAYESARVRYARGEISREQYDQILNDLERPGYGQFH